MVIATVCYIGGGAAYAIKVQGKGTDKPKELLPHPEFWLTVKALVFDGVAFTVLQAKAHLNKSSSTVGYEPLKGDTQHDGPQKEEEELTPNATPAKKSPLHANTVAKHVENHPAFGKAISPPIGVGVDSSSDEELVE
jgi:hypothetical protein